MGSVPLLLSIASGSRSMGLHLVIEYLRMCNYLAAQRVTCFIANSHFVAQRIAKYYGLESTVIYPPVRTADAFISNQISDYYLSVGRLIPAEAR